MRGRIEVRPAAHVRTSRWADGPVQRARPALLYAPQATPVARTSDEALLARLQQRLKGQRGCAPELEHVAIAPACARDGSLTVGTVCKEAADAANQVNDYYEHHAETRDVLDSVIARIELASDLDARRCCL